MSRVHDALRRAEQLAASNPQPVAPADIPPGALATRYHDGGGAVTVAPSIIEGLIERIKSVPYAPSAEAHLLDPTRPHEAPSEEFRTVRTRLNHMQTLQPIHTIVITSPSPAEGKSFAAMNLALTESQLDGNKTLIIDCDFRRPVVHTLLNLERSPGMTEYLQGKCELHEAIRHISGSNLYVMPAGESVLNPLELLNLREMQNLIQELPKVFNWVMIDSPPLLFAADANLLSTMTDGTVLVVRIGTTTIDSVTRAMQSLCENNVLGIMVNGARRGELYSKYTYYHSYYYTRPDEGTANEEGSESKD